MATYDRTILYDHADALYNRAKMVAISYAARYVAIASMLYWGLMAYTRKESEVDAWLIVAVTAGTIGWFIGNSKAFHYKLLAQQTLCQMQIEYNTNANRSTANGDKGATVSSTR